MHTLISGMTESGKTVLAKIICLTLKKSGKKCAVLDPLHDIGWQCDFQTHDGPTFLAWARRPENQTSYLFIDEGSISVGKYDTQMQWLATMSRHWGHSVFFVTQDATQIAPIIRSNCSRVFLFASPEAAGKRISEEFNQPKLRGAPRLARGHFYIVSRFGEMSENKVDFASGSVRLVSSSTSEKPRKDTFDDVSNTSGVR